MGSKSISSFVPDFSSIEVMAHVDEYTKNINSLQSELEKWRVSNVGSEYCLIVRMMVDGRERVFGEDC